ncbi:Smad nuclear interacting protein 1 S homeolog [Xenopus laevis]|uniref:MGC81042 protein n=1 Tax=Xenopus laevis TaxID=8355 RepID=Q6DE04_XENLA|nr:Smad nuclear interacting protein 1 S homeolog [Xenopus laevis]AAH77343.1 MGC81042 protein [Xenopus laevis]
MKEEDDKRRKQRAHSPEPVTIKQERISPVRQHRTRRTPSPRSSDGGSPHRHQGRRRSRSPSRKNKPSFKRSKSPKNKRHRSDSRSPPPLGVKIKQEKVEHSQRPYRDRPHKDRGQEDHRKNRNRDQTDQDRYNRPRPRDRERNREEQNFRDQREEREFYNDQRRERRQRDDQAVEEQNEDVNNSTEEGSSNKEKPNFELSGALLEDTNIFRGVVIKYSEPQEARIPKKRWRLYPFKNDEALPVMYVHRQSAYLLGRQRRIADIPVDHPSCSKQHAVLQYRMVEFTRANGTSGRRVRPYIIDLGSGNGTYLNNQRIEPQRYYELKEKDVLKFGFSSREYVVLHETSDTSEVDKKQDEDEDEEDEGTDS